LLFTSFSFLFVFLPLVLVVYQRARGPAKNLVLLLASYVFYGWWRIDFLLLLLVCTAVDYVAGLAIGSTHTPTQRRLALAISIFANLGLLGFFKYANFAVENLNALRSWTGSAPLPWNDVLLPAGISFVTFQTMSYTIDVYRKTITPTRSLLEFATFVALFPQLVAGPIVRYEDVARELRERSVDQARLATGSLRFMIGLNKKVLIANNVALIADDVFLAGPAGFADAWVGLLAYTLQIYFDFSAYSDMAIGLGHMFGFTFPENFAAPYRSRSITEFWRRWHISLGTWIRDYLYTALGGNRHGAARTYGNLMLSMLLAGAWHGANWTFMAWGVFHGALLVAERVHGRRAWYAGLPPSLQVAATLLLVMLGWVLFRADSISDAASYYGRLFNPAVLGTAGATFRLWEPFTIAVCAVSLVLVFAARTAQDLCRTPMAPLLVVQAALFPWSLLELYSQGYNPFLYFQF
jgi:alginate O-acetyltransferase complex protein AlgI